MMKTRIIFLRHAETEKNPSLNAYFWSLSEKGKLQAEEVSNIPAMQDADLIYTSEEDKTALTVEPLATKLNKKIKIGGAFNEVKRGDKFLTKEEFELQKNMQLNNLNYKTDGESGFEALERFKKGVSDVIGSNKGKTILIVTHGTILNIYFADLLNEYKKLPERWAKTKFTAYGIVEEGVVIKDIV